MADSRSADPALADSALADSAPAESGQTDDEANVAAWESLIVDLEATAQAARFALATRSEEASSVAEWRPPVDLGPIPAQLIERARAVLDSQFEVMRRIETARDAAGAHITALRTARQSRPSDRSVYLDVTG